MFKTIWLVSFFVCQLFICLYSNEIYICSNQSEIIANNYGEPIQFPKLCINRNTGHEYTSGNISVYLSSKSPVKACKTFYPSNGLIYGDLTSKFSIIIENGQYIIKDYLLNVYALCYPLSVMELNITVSFDKYSSLSTNNAFKMSFPACNEGEYLFGNQCKPCEIGSYSLSSDWNGAKCKLCPNNAKICENNTIIVKSGFWRISNKSDIIQQCLLGDVSCRGGNLASHNQCNSGYYGYLCNNCNQGYYFSYLINKCVQCNFMPNSFSILVTSSIFIIVLFALLGLRTDFLYYIFAINKVRANLKVRPSDSSVVVSYDSNQCVLNTNSKYNTAVEHETSKSLENGNMVGGVISQFVAADTDSNNVNNSINNRSLENNDTYHRNVSFLKQNEGSECVGASSSYIPKTEKPDIKLNIRCSEFICQTTPGQHLRSFHSLQSIPKLRITITCFQIIGMFPSILRIQYTSSVSTLFEIFRYLSIPFAPIVVGAYSCYLPININYIMYMYMYTIIPIIVILSIFLMYYVVSEYLTTSYIISNPFANDLNMVYHHRGFLAIDRRQNTTSAVSPLDVESRVPVTSRAASGELSTVYGCSYIRATMSNLIYCLTGLNVNLHTSLDSNTDSAIPLRVNQPSYRNNKLLRLQIEKQFKFFLYVVLLFTYVIVPKVCIVLFGIFNCTNIYDDELNEYKMFLVNDLSISCESYEYHRAYLYSVVMILVYAIGIPLVWFYFLCLNRVSISRRRHNSSESTINTSVKPVAVKSPITKTITSVSSHARNLTSNVDSNCLSAKNYSARSSLPLRNDTHSVVLSASVSFPNCNYDEPVVNKVSIEQFQDETYENLNRYTEEYNSSNHHGELTSGHQSTAGIKSDSKVNVQYIEVVDSENNKADADSNCLFFPVTSHELEFLYASYRPEVWYW